VRRARDIVDPKTDIVHVVPLNVREWEARVVIGKEGVVEELIV
jgi:CRISPR-associated protein Cas2